MRMSVVSVLLLSPLGLRASAVKAECGRLFQRAQPEIVCEAGRREAWGSGGRVVRLP